MTPVLRKAHWDIFRKRMRKLNTHPVRRLVTQINSKLGNCTWSPVLKRILIHTVNCEMRVIVNILEKAAVEVIMLTSPLMLVITSLKPLSHSKVKDYQ